MVRGPLPFKVSAVCKDETLSPRAVMPVSLAGDTHISRLMKRVKNSHEVWPLLLPISVFSVLASSACQGTENHSTNLSLMNSAAPPPQGEASN